MFMVLSSWQSHCESSPGSFDESRTAPSGRRQKTKPDDLGCESACTGCQSLHPPSPFIITTQPERWYSFYCPTEGRRLSRSGWLVTYRDGLPAHGRSPILVLTGSDVAQLRWSRPTRNHQAKPTGCIQLLSQLGVSTPQRQPSGTSRRLRCKVAHLLQRDRSILRVIECFAKSLEIIEGQWKWHYSKAWAQFSLRIL